MVPGKIKELRGDRQKKVGGGRVSYNAYTTRLLHFFSFFEIPTKIIFKKDLRS